MKTVRSNQIPIDDKSTIISDEIIQFTNKNNGSGRPDNSYYGTELRRIKILRDCGKVMTFVTNDLERSAQEIAKLYKRRWDIELFFKWLKQNLEIKRFLGQSDNAVRIQIYCAIIAYLLVWIYRKSHGIKTSMKLLLVELRTDLFGRPTTQQYVHKRSARRRAEVEKIQASLAF